MSRYQVLIKSFELTEVDTNTIAVSQRYEEKERPTWTEQTRATF